MFFHQGTNVDRLRFFLTSLWAVVGLILMNTPLGTAAIKAKDMFEDFASPVTTQARYSLLVGGMTTGTFYLDHRGEVREAENTVARERPLGVVSPFADLAGQMIPNGVYALGMLIHGWLDPQSKTSFQRSWMMLEATLYSVSWTTVLKHTVREARPNNRDERNSFPSGHATSAFAFAGLIWAEHSWPWGLSALGLASLVGVGRINDHKHYIHDVLAGATLGLSYGLGVSYRMKQRLQSEKDREDLGVPAEKIQDAKSRASLASRGLVHWWNVQLAPLSDLSGGWTQVQLGF